MKSVIYRSKSILLAICLALTLGTIASAQIESKEETRFYEMTKLPTRALAAGQMDQARKDSLALLKEAENWKENWNYGNAVHVANLVLGHVALAAGDVKKAKAFLLAAGKTPGSPQLNSFGPNMRLAKAFLEKGEPEVVLAYFELCAVFWKPDLSPLDEWRAAVKKNEIPDFRANLNYQFEK